ncbi:MAG TPA: bestrophin family ion channel, partial [Microcoleus sp.]|nr:bestrophin family ion channel [Microcoleus sp.]
MSGDRPHWFKIALQVRGSVIPSILPRVLLCGGFGVLISLLHFLNWPVSLPILSSIVPSIVLGLLLVFRTNTAYERFWEGRKMWGTLVNNVRNLARQIWVAIEEKKPQDIELKKSVLRLLPAFAVALKLHLRQQSVNPELEQLMSPAHYQKLKSMNNPPLEIAFWIEDYLHEQYEGNCVDVYQLTGMKELINSMIDVLGGCERILKTPIPLAYAIHLKQLLLLYCLALPFQMVNDLTWGTGPIVALISFTLFG